MKKSIFFVIVVIVLCVGSLFTCYAAYSYSSPPGKWQTWDFTSNKSYTIFNEFDIYYYKGSWGLIKNENTKVRSCTKAIPYWYSTCIAAVQSSNGHLYASYSGMGDTSNREMHSGWADARNYDTPQAVQYEYSFFQVNGNTAINERRHFYRSEWGLD